TVAEQIAALRRIAGDKVAARVRREPDPLGMRIVDGWPHRVDAARASELGFVAGRSFGEIIRIHIQGGLRGGVPAPLVRSSTRSARQEPHAFSRAAHSGYPAAPLQALPGGRSAARR